LFTSKQVQKWFEKHISQNYPEEMIGLLSPAPTANLSIVRRVDYKAWKLLNPERNIDAFRVLKYKEVFCAINKLKLG
jgi:hypothetical protein